MIDLHNHIIFDVDDGSESLEQSMRMIRSAKEAGFSELCFTPHYMEDGYRTERNILEQKFFQIKDCIDRENIGVKLYLGEEIFIFPNLVDKLDEVICINDTRYILIEFPLFEELGYIEDVIYKLLSYGKVPIIAHPERYYSSAKDFDFVLKLIQKVALLQMNMNSIIGHYGKDARNIAIKLLKNDLVHIIGSDAHTTATYNCTNQSIAEMKKIISEAKLNELMEINPRKILNDEEIEIVLPDNLKELSRNKNRLCMNLFRRRER